MCKGKQKAVSKVTAVLLTLMILPKPKTMNPWRGKKLT